MKSIEEEKAECIEWNTRVLAEMGLWADATRRKDGSLIAARCVYHNQPLTFLFEPFGRRIETILKAKTQATQSERLRNFRLLPEELYKSIPQELFDAGKKKEAAWNAYIQAQAELHWASRDMQEMSRKADLTFLFGDQMPPHTWNGKTLEGVPDGK